MVWRTREASRPPGDHEFEPHQDFPARSRPYTTAGQEGGFPDTRPQTSRGGRREGDSQTRPNTTAGEGGRDSQSTPPEPTREREGGRRLPRPFGGVGGWGGSLQQRVLPVFLLDKASLHCAAFVVLCAGSQVDTKWESSPAKGLPPHSLTCQAVVKNLPCFVCVPCRCNVSVCSPPFHNQTPTWMAENCAGPRSA